jgi:iron-sulfur cluster repair protein YtfE (RIC family)
MVDVAGLRLEHHALGAHVDTLRTVADGIGVVDAETTLAGVDNLDEFLTHHLLPHARAEEAVLYPLIDQLMGAADATATMRRDHAEIVRLAEELAELREALHSGPAPVSTERDLRRILYGLHVLVALHLAKEDEIYAPLLESRVDGDTAETLTQQMQDATQAAD